MLVQICHVSPLERHAVAHGAHADKLPAAEALRGAPRPAIGAVASRGTFDRS
eukprot:SAG31_NODE_18165_length_644_cov_13.959633_1_plen_52_part_00